MKSTKTYAEKLLDPRWQKKRLEVLENSGWRCEFCETTRKQLHVHHLRYRDCDPWEYEAYELSCCCCDCHAEIHSRKKSGDHAAWDKATGRMQAIEMDSGLVFREWSFKTQEIYNKAVRLAMDQIGAIDPNDQSTWPWRKK